MSIIKQVLSISPTGSKLCIAVHKGEYCIIRIDGKDEIAIANKLVNQYPIGFNPVEAVDGDVVVYPKLIGLKNTFKTSAQNYDIMLKSFICQIIGILHEVDKAEMHLSSLANKDIGILYSKSEQIKIAGKIIQTHGSIYKLVNYDIIKPGKDPNIMLKLLDIFAKVNCNFPPNWEQILDNIEKKKYVNNFQVKSRNPLHRFWGYILFHPKIVSRELGRPLTVIKYLPDGDYLAIFGSADDFNKLINYFADK